MASRLLQRQENGINENVIIHRLYGAVNIGDKSYRVKTTLKEDHAKENPKKAYSYEATKIELLPGQSENPVGFSRNDNNSISGAKLLQGVEKSYEPGKKLLDDSENIQESGQDEGLDAAKTDEKLSREGDGAYTDGELSLINDPVAKWLGKSQRTKAQQKSFAERQR